MQYLQAQTIGTRGVSLSNVISDGKISMQESIKSDLIHLEVLTCSFVTNNNHHNQRCTTTQRWHIFHSKFHTCTRTFVCNRTKQAQSKQNAGNSRPFKRLRKFRTYSNWNVLEVKSNRGHNGPCWDCFTICCEILLFFANLVSLHFLERVMEI